MIYEMCAKISICCGRCIQLNLCVPAPFRIIRIECIWVKRVNKIGYTVNEFQQNVIQLRDKFKLPHVCQPLTNLDMTRNSGRMSEESSSHGEPT